MDKSSRGASGSGRRFGDVEKQIGDSNIKTKKLETEKKEKKQKISTHEKSDVGGQRFISRYKADQTHPRLPLYPPPIFALLEISK
jgi:hypothetical protein